MGLTSAADRSSMSCGYYRDGIDGYWVTFYDADRSEGGTIPDSAIVGIYGSAEEAQSAIDGVNSK